MTKQEQDLNMAVPPPLPLSENSVQFQDDGEHWDFSDATQSQGATPDLVPTSPSFDYSDVVFPGPARDFLRKQGMHSLYVIQSLDLVKIGIASDVVARLKAMTCDNPHGIELKTAFLVPHVLVHWAEMHCHAKLLPYHHHGEWFRIDAQIAMRVARTVCQRAANARGVRLTSAMPKGRKWLVTRSGPPGSLRLMPQMLDYIANPDVGGKPYEVRRALERKRERGG